MCVEDAVSPPFDACISISGEIKHGYMSPLIRAAAICAGVSLD